MNEIISGLQELLRPTGSLLARTIMRSHEQHEVQICFRDDPKHPDHYRSVLEADIDVLPNGDWTVQSRIRGGTFFDTMDRNEGTTPAGYKVTRGEIDKKLLKQIIEGLPEEERQRLPKFLNNCKGLKPAERKRLIRLAQHKSVWDY